MTDIQSTEDSPSEARKRRAQAIDAVRSALARIDGEIRR